MSNKTDVQSKSQFFDKAYRMPVTLWGDVRIPKELKELVEKNKPQTSLELGCGLGRFSTYMSEQGINATAVDFSSVAIEKAKNRITRKEYKPIFLIGDVTNLSMLTNQFDVSFDIGCFHCLDEEDEEKYVSEIYRLLKPGATHLIWTLNGSPSGIKLNPDYIAKVFGSNFKLVKSKPSRRRIIASKWYWLVRNA
jgi:ubiquinone/menaquinone biosynthesis C-methylase UbiE